MERAKHGSLSWNFWLNWFSVWGSKTLHIKGFPASFPVYLPAWHILAVHRYLTYNWMVLCLCEACSRDMGWLSSGGQPFDNIPFTGKWFQCWFPVPAYLPGCNIFISLSPPFPTNLTQPLTPATHTPPIVGRSVQWKNRRIYMGKTSITCQLDAKKPSHPVSFKTLPWIYNFCFLHLWFAPLYFSSSSIWQYWESLNRPTMCLSVAWSMQCCYSHEQVLRATTFLTNTDMC